MIAFEFTPIAEEHMARNGYFAKDMLGTIPTMLSAEDPARAVDQIDRKYRAADPGGWRDRYGFALDREAGTLTYPGDAPRHLIAKAKLRDEEVLFFNGAWIAVVRPDGSFRVACID